MSGWALLAAVTLHTAAPAAEPVARLEARARELRHALLYATGTVLAVEPHARGYQLTVDTETDPMVFDVDEDTRVLMLDGTALGSATVLVPGERVTVEYLQTRAPHVNALFLN